MSYTAPNTFRPHPTLKGVEIDDDGNRIVRSKDGTILTAKAGDWIPLTKIYSGKILGTTIWTHMTLVLFFIAVIAFECVIDLAGGLAVAYGLIYIVVLWITLFIHELGTLVVGRKFHGEVHDLYLWPLGGLDYNCMVKDPGTDMFVSLAGPVTHIPLCILFAALLFLDGDIHEVVFLETKLEDDFGIVVLVGLLAMQVVLFIFNVIWPVYPLNGGRLLLDIFVWRNVSMTTAAVIVLWINLVLGLSFLGYTIYQWVEHDGGATRIMSLVLLIWVIYQNIFLYRARNSEEKLLKLPLMAPYRMQQLRMADDVARAETEERLAQMHAENGDGNDEDGTTPVVPSSGDATARDNGGGAEDNEEEPAWAEESAEESGGGASVAPTHNGAPPESADNQPQLSAKEVAAQRKADAKAAKEAKKKADKDAKEKQKLDARAAKASAKSPAQPNAVEENDMFAGINSKSSDGGGYMDIGDDDDAAPLELQNPFG